MFAGYGFYLQFISPCLPLYTIGVAYFRYTLYHLQYRDQLYAN